ncbi:hypothetical protein PQX77_013922, partial [Marasmius sp. AFHP31]
MSDFFSNAQNFSINGGTFSGINGDQHNHYYKRAFQASRLSTSRSGSRTQGTTSRAITTTIHINGNQINKQIVERPERKLTEFDDFRSLKRGDICRLRDICQVLKPCKDHWRWGCQCSREVIKTVCTAKLIGVEGEFTVVSYRGHDARRAFEAEFREVSRSLYVKWQPKVAHIEGSRIFRFSEVAQVYAIDKGMIPSMVFWHGLAPLAQVLGNVGYLGSKYLKRLHNQWRCAYEEMWIDPTRGVVCRGPKGPDSYVYGDELEFEDLPPTTELLQEEILVRFLASQRLKEADDAFMDAMYHASNDEEVPERVDRPTILSALTKTPIAIANSVWTSLTSDLVERTCLENGWTRFQLNGDELLKLWLNGNIERAWLSQAWSVFHARGVLLEDNLEDFKLVHPWVLVPARLDDSPAKRQLRGQQPIYLFVYPPPPNILDDFAELGTFSLVTVVTVADSI